MHPSCQLLHAPADNLESCGAAGGHLVNNQQLYCLQEVDEFVQTISSEIFGRRRMIRVEMLSIVVAPLPRFAAATPAKTMVATLSYDRNLLRTSLMAILAVCVFPVPPVPSTRSRSGGPSLAAPGAAGRAWRHAIRKSAHSTSTSASIFCVGSSSLRPR